MSDVTHVTFQGSPLQLEGQIPRVGQAAGAFHAAANDLSPVNFPDDFAGQVVVLVSVPSLDTPVCDVEARRFNQEAARLAGVKVLVVSMDLPFAQARWCGAAGIQNVQTLSDYQSAAFGQAYGVLIHGLRLLARAVFVVGKDGTIRYVQVVREITNEPDYEEALAAIRAAAK